MRSAYYRTASGQTKPQASPSRSHTSRPDRAARRLNLSMRMAVTAVTRAVFVVAMLAWGGAGAALLAQPAQAPAGERAAGQRPSPPPPAPPAGQEPDAAGEDAGAPADLPVSLDRIRRRAADERAPAFTLPAPGELPTFAVTIERRLPRFEDFVLPGELDPGPVGATSPYHAEMMTMITPPEARPYGAFTGGNLLAVVLQSLLTGYVGQQVPGWLEQAMRAQREAEARREVQAVVDELERRQAVQELERRRTAQDAAEREAQGTTPDAGTTTPAHPPPATPPPPP
jgi:hypothetical protein